MVLDLWIRTQTRFGISCGTKLFIERYYRQDDYDQANPGLKFSEDRVSAWRGWCVVELRDKICREISESCLSHGPLLPKHYGNLKKVDR